jgi:hypothetical protein
MPGLGRLPSPPDPRDQRYLARSVFKVDEPTVMHRNWYTENTRKYNQGDIGQCTMYSLAHLLAAGPVTQRPYTYKGDAPIFDTISGYCRAQEIDKRDYGWGDPTFCADGRKPGGRGDWGATMRSACKVGQEMGYITHYWWLLTIDELVAYMANVGPAWLGIPWFEGMDEPDGKGFIHPTGGARGGHAIVSDQLVLRQGYIWLLNTWGLAWGNRNRAKMWLHDLEAMLKYQQGEAVAITEVRPDA